MRDDFMRAIQRKVAVSAIPASAMRGQGARGVVRAARDYVTSISLDAAKGLGEDTFGPWLDGQTESLRKALPHGARGFGTARKAMNLFLRDALYNRYLSQHYSLNALEDWLEIPLDSITAAELTKRDESRLLAPWPGVRRVSPSLSHTYQALARAIGKSEGIARVHLDAYWWGAERRDAWAQGKNELI